MSVDFFKEDRGTCIKHEQVPPENSSSDDSEAVPSQPTVRNSTDDSDAVIQTDTGNDTDSLAEIRLGLRSTSISYYDLMKKPELAASLIATIQQKFASLAGGIATNVRVMLAPGSLLMFVTILVPDNTALQTRNQVTQQVDDGSLAGSLAIDISLIPGISEVSLGPISINVESIEGQVLEVAASNDTFQLARRGHLLTTDLGFELSLAGGTWLLCYTFGGAPDHSSSSMKIADLPIFGAAALRSVGSSPRAGQPFALEVYAPLGGLLLEDRLMIVEADGTGCGAAATTPYLAGTLGSPDLGTTGDFNTSLQWTDVAIRQAGIYTGCWCWSGQGSCSSGDDGNASHLYSLALNNFTVHGPLSFQPARVAAGDSFDLVLFGVELSSLDVIRLVNGSVCGTAAADIRGDVDGQGGGSARAWSNLTVMEFGSYQVCWCYMSSTNCSNDEDADFAVGVLDVWGPVITEHRCTMSSTCAITLYGVPSHNPSSILLRSGQTSCEKSNSPPVDVHGLTNPQRSQAAAAGVYSRIRFSPIRARSGKTIQLGELVLYFNGSLVDMHGASTSRLLGGRGPVSEGPAYAVDKRRSTKFLDFDGVGFEIVLRFPARIDAVSYITANDGPERDPTSFLLEGFTDKWHVLAVPSHLSPPLERFTETQRIPCVVGVPGDERLA